jgi:hypothetical protein
MNRITHLFSRIAVGFLAAAACLAAGAGCGDSPAPPAIEWSEATLPAAAVWESVAYGGGVFAAISYSEGSAEASDEAAYSADGKTWTRAAMPSNQNWTGIAYGHGVFAAVAWCDAASAATDEAAWSSDGATWTATKLPATALWSSVTSVSGGFIAMSSGTSLSAAAFSSDGKTWSSVELGASACWQKAVGAGTDCVSIAWAGSGHGITAVTSRSADSGLSWSSGGQLPSNACWQDLAYKDGTFFALAAKGGLPEGSGIAAYSADGGASWLAAGLSADADWKGIASGAGVFATVAFDVDYALTDRAAWSSDGSAWHRAVLPYEHNWNSPIFGGRCFIALPYDESANSAYSRDGKVWIAMELPHAACWQASAYGGGVFVALARTCGNAPTTIAAYSD